jgi:hypothetical protein
MLMMVKILGILLEIRSVCMDDMICIRQQLSDVLHIDIKEAKVFMFMMVEIRERV